ncbi:MAG: hypothetical protein IJG70_07020 [Kiritimatiellae bacterium]|nr:hypothetical protein [Kiritimatiellia bacterium]
MKKLMIAALAVASVGAAYASDACGYITPDTAWVYKWTFSGKTTVGKTLKAAKVAKGNACGYSGSSSAQTTVCGYAVRVPASLKIEGYTWVCKPGCGSDAFEQFAEQNEIFWQNKPFKASLSGGVATDISNIIGTKAKQFEAAGIAKFTAYADNVLGGNDQGAYTLTYAGLGKYDAKNSRVSSVAGNFAGVLDQPYYIGSVTVGLLEIWCPPAGFWECNTGALLCGPSVAFGKWNAKFQSSLSKKYLNVSGSWNGGENAILKKVPKWAAFLNRAE